MFFYAFCFETEMTFITIVYKKSLPRKSKFKQKKNAIHRLFELAIKKNVAIDPFELIECSVLS